MDIDPDLNEIKQLSTELNENTNESWEKRLKFEFLISELSAQFINLPVDRIDDEIEKGQMRVCNALGLNRSVLTEFLYEKNHLISTHMWCAEGVAGDRPETFPEEWGYFVNTFIKQGEVMLYSDVTGLPADEKTNGPEQFAKKIGRIAKKIGLTSIAMFPLSVGDYAIGLISWESYGIDIQWKDEMVNRLRLISDVFANSLARKRNEEALRRSIVEIKDLKDRLQEENLYLLDEIRLEKKHHKIVGQSRSIKKVLRQVEQVAGTTTPVLILGETGTGKELVAQAIHDLSQRKDHPMVKVNCSALAPTLIESELFGHEKGAYTGALSRRIGRFELAKGSTIFLDEIGDLSLELQAKLLRVLQEGQFERLGSSNTCTVDTRIIAATNRDLARSVLEGTFRKDLYFRINIFPITVPPLRERIDDLPLLCKAFIHELSISMKKNVDTIPNSCLESLKQYDWPGNIRELRGLVERAMITARGKSLDIQLPKTIGTETSDFDTLDVCQRKHILKALEKTGGRVYGDSGAGKLLGINSNTLVSRMKRLKIKRNHNFS